MTIEIRQSGTAAIGLGDLLAGLEEARFDADEEASFLDQAPALAALGRNRDFLGDLMIAELKDRADGQERFNDFGPQVLMLHRGPGWFVRANIWPDTSDPLYRASGPRRFFYDVPHDHNFHFLTVGHLGPGYASDYYQVDHAALRGATGERARLRFVERSCLHEGRLLFYRAHEDVHSQHPPAATSVSLNIVQGTAGRAFLDQYRYDVDRDLIAGQLAASSADALVALLPTVGGGEGLDLLDRFAAGHPSDRIRFGAIVALASRQDRAGRIACLERAARTGSPAIAAMARARIGRMSAGRAWVRDGISGSDD